MRYSFVFVLSVSSLLITIIECYKPRFKRDFMYIADTNGTDTDCYMDCNGRYRMEFEYSLNMNATDFYDFPMHPLVLSERTFLLYCKLSQRKTDCYRKKCDDQSADTVFSPSNFLCDFRRSLFEESRQCLANAEPITFLKCDQDCHDSVVKRKQHKLQTADMNQVFSASFLSTYERELDLLCSFQACYLECMQPVVKEVCPPAQANKAIQLVRSFLEWHAADVADWHTVTDHYSTLPESCRTLDNRHEDPVIQIIGAA